MVWLAAVIENENRIAISRSGPVFNYSSLTGHGARIQGPVLPVKTEFGRSYETVPVGL